MERALVVRSLPAVVALVLAGSIAAAEERGAASKPDPELASSPALEPVAVAALPEGVDRVDIYLLMGQSNMRGRGAMTGEVARDPRIVMLHLTRNEWYIARHPLHHEGDPKTHEGCSREGVGSGLSFARTVAEGDPRVRIALVPCAAGGSSIAMWQKGEQLYERAVRRARLALKATARVRGRIRGALWLQGEADRRRHVGYMAKLAALIDALREDLGDPKLPFIACTIGEFRDGGNNADTVAINEVLLGLPAARPHTACVDARDLKGRSVGPHYDTASQVEIGRRYAAKLKELAASAESEGRAGSVGERRRGAGGEDTSGRPAAGTKRERDERSNSTGGNGG